MIRKSYIVEEMDMKPVSSTYVMDANVFEGLLNELSRGTLHNYLDHAPGEISFYKRLSKSRDLSKRDRKGFKRIKRNREKGEERALTSLYNKDMRGQNR